MNRIVSVLLVAGLVACRGDLYAPPSDVEDATLEIADAAHGFNTGFYWLPPLVLQPVYSGVFDPALSPTVQICELEGDACARIVATYTTTDGPGGEVVRVVPDEELYHVNWQTAKFPLSPGEIYRVSVRAGAGDVLLGYLDAQLVDNGAGLRNVNTGEKIGVQAGRTLPIKFRIETDIPGQIAVQPVETEAAPGATLQFVAEVTDLHGNPLSADLTWSSSDDGVATVDQTGLATAMRGGVATITATTRTLGGMATLRVTGGHGMVDAGNFHACGLDVSGRAFCWGFNTLGQLGDGTTGGRLAPVPASGGLAFSTIEAGGNHTCAITAAGAAYCWGSNQFGQLGDGSIQSRNIPTPVSGGTAGGFIAISVGATHTCGVTAAHEAYCWGDGTQGRLGNGSETAQHTPQPVSGGLSFASISAGGSHTCGLTTSGEAYCWGLGFFGALGNGSVTNRPTPVAVNGGRTYASIQAGTNHTCALTTDGEAFCWGSDLRGQLGDGTTGVRLSPVPVAGTLRFDGISAGSLHTCGVTTSGQAYCWGANQSGQLGDGTLVDRRIPAAVSGGLTFESISAGTGTDSFTCGVTTTGDRYCWGSGRLGTLGNGTTTTAQTTPVPVSPLP